MDIWLFTSLLVFSWFQPVSTSINKTEMAEIRSSIEISDSLVNATQPEVFTNIMAAPPIVPIVTFISTTTKIVDIILKYTSNKPSQEILEIKRLWYEVSEKFKLVEIQLKDLSRQINWAVASIQFGNIENRIDATYSQLENIYNHPISMKDMEKQQFFVEYENECSTCALELYNGIIKEDLSLTRNLMQTAVGSLKNDRHKIQRFMIGTLLLLIKGITSDLTYKNLKYDNAFYQRHQREWAERLKKVFDRMNTIDNEVKSKWHDQANIDIDETSTINSTQSNQVFSQSLYNKLKGKYFWRDWLVIAYQPIWGVSTHISHACDGFKKYGAHGRNILIASVDKTKKYLDMKKAALMMVNVRTKTYSETGCSYNAHGGSSRGSFSENRLNAYEVYMSIPGDTRTCSLYGSFGVIDSWKDVWYRAPDDRLLQFRTPGTNSYSIHLFG